MAKAMKEEEKTLTVEEAGRRYFKISRQSAYSAVKKGDIPSIRIGGLLRVPVAAMERLMLEAGTKKEVAEQKKRRPFSGAALNQRPVRNTQPKGTI